ncbi:MAG: DUF5686 and carboxypeptidase regulatory-like domain-containing protein [Paludibacter sp.]|nr:DUF5686 and carboxypeptidase regulatory-like domain-containing protein [Paludibacter sp.]
MSCILSNHKKNFFQLFFLCFSALISAQETLVIGQVLDEDREPLADVNVYFEGTDIGMQTNNEGYFLVRTMGNETVVVFSHIGYRKEKLKVQRGQSVGTEIIMKEDIMWLSEVFVRPGENPALKLMRKVEQARKRNNITNNPNFTTFGNVENSIFLINKNIDNKIFKRLESVDLTYTDTFMTIPVFHSNEKFKVEQKTKIPFENNDNKEDKTADLFFSKLQILFNENIDFYQNTVFLFGKSFISPLSTVRNTFYNFFLIDSISVNQLKFYQIDFRSKNRKNLAFNGKMLIDSATYALVEISVELPNQANLNFIKKLKISQYFEKKDSAFFYKNAEKISCNLDYHLFADTTAININLYFTSNSTFAINENDVKIPLSANFSEQQISEKMAALKATPLYKTAIYIADIFVTSNAKIGIIDFGNVNNILRLSKIEGLRVALPLQTNEDFLHNFALGGHIAYGLANKEIKYYAFTKWKLPTQTKRLFSAGYFNDYRRIEYDYNDFLLREEPFSAADENFQSTFLSFRKANKMNLRRELFASFTNDWNNSFETTFILRHNLIFADESLPFIQNTNVINSFSNNLLTISMRFSKNQQKYEDHLQRIYLPTRRPILYFMSEIGKYSFGSLSGYYGKLSTTLSQKLPFELGIWKYAARADVVFGAVPFLLLAYPYGNETHNYNLLKFSMLNYLQIPADKNLQLHNEITFNGIIFNQIPFVRRFDLREMLTFKIGYGWIDKSKHAQIADFPAFMHRYTKPYAEFGAGITNILRLFAFHVVCATPTSTQNNWQWTGRFYFCLSF